MICCRLGLSSAHARFRLGGPSPANWTKDNSPLSVGCLVEVVLNCLVTAAFENDVVSRGIEGSNALPPPSESVLSEAQIVNRTCPDGSRSSRSAMMMSMQAPHSAAIRLRYGIKTNPETSAMSTVDANRVILTGENSVIRLNNSNSDSFTTNATFWRILSSPGGPGHVLYLKSELTEARWRIYSDNIAMARWLQSTVLGAINAELLDLTIAVTDAQFSKSGDTRDFWTERLETRDEQIALTWYEMGEPLLVHTQPNSTPGRPYGMCTVLVPALGARLTRNGIEAEGRPWPREREGRPSSTCVLGLCESWTQAR